MSGEVKKEAPAPEGGAVSIWSDARNVFVRYAELFAMTERYEEASAIADKAAHEIEALATREVAPAEWFGVTGAVDETEALAVALFAVRCPGVRMTDEDLHHYRSAAKRAMQVVSAELSGNPGQLDAPAEAGENWPTLADLHTIKGWLYGLSTAPDLTDVVADGGVSVGDCYQQEAREFAGRIERIINSLRAQPPAREDAQPVAYRMRCQSDQPHKGGWWSLVEKHDGDHAIATGGGKNLQPLYTHPAPDAPRVAVEALTVARSQAERGADKAGCDGWRSQEMCRQVVQLIDKALAALQAEPDSKS